MKLMPEIKSIKDLEKYVNDLAAKAMSQGNAVKETVIETGKRHVQEDVYDKYPNPKVYERTGELKENWNWQDAPDGIEIYNMRFDDGRYVAEIVETGRGYQYDFEYNGIPRPFIENTREELRNGNELTN